MPSKELTDLDVQLARLVELTRQLAETTEAAVSAFQREFDRQRSTAKDSVRLPPAEVE